MRALAIVGGVIAAALIYVFAFTSPAQPLTAKPVVKVTLTQGHGSGFHIGKGYIVTAAHVVGVASEVGIQSTDGQKRTATVLWANKAHDIALLRMDDFDGLASSPLACVTPQNGDKLIAEGNPLFMEFLTTRGYVAGEPREIGPWKIGVPVDLSLLMGMSGGPVLDEFGNVVGVTVGFMAAPMGFAKSWTDFGVIVSGEVVCDLMGRGV